MDAAASPSSPTASPTNCAGACSGAAAPTTAPATTAEPTDELPPVDTSLSGTIEFGKSFDESTLEIVNPVARFKTTTKVIAYVAHLSEAAGTTDLTLSLTRRASGGAETSIFNEPLTVASPEYDTLANKADLALLADNKAGTYILRVIREGDTLAEGTFTLVR